MTPESDTGDPIQPADSSTSWSNDGTDTTKLPAGLELVRTTPVFTETTVPAAVVNAHKTAKGVWGRLVVHTGELDFTFEDQPDQVHHLCAGQNIPIAPQRPHHVTVDGPSTFVVEFYRFSTDPEIQS